MEDNQTSKQLVEGFAVAATAMSLSATDPRISLPIRGAAAILALVARIMEGRSLDESRAILEKIATDGVKPIGQDELDAQGRAVLAWIDEEEDELDDAS